MNAKEKAKELVDKFSVVSLQQREEGIACAIIAVDEIMKNYQVQYKYCVTLQFWNEVKKEIEKL